MWGISKRPSNFYEFDVSYRRLMLVMGGRVFFEKEEEFISECFNVTLNSVYNNRYFRFIIGYSAFINT